MLQAFYWLFLSGCLLFAVRDGGMPERIGVGIIAAGSVLSLALSSERALRFQGIESGIFIVDMVVLAAFLVLALRSERFWPLWATGFHIVGVATHVATAVNPEVVPRAYALAQGFWAYPMLVAAICGTIAHRRRQRATAAAAPPS